MGLEPRRDAFGADLAGLGGVRLVNLLAVVPGASPRTIVVLAHRDNSGTTPGANDNATGTGVLLELARNAELVRPKHTIVFASTDGGAFGGAGAARIADRPEVIRRLAGTSASVIAVVNLDSLAGQAPPRILFAGEEPRSPTSALLATADESIEVATGASPLRPTAFAQLVDLGFPFTLHEQGPFVARGTPAVTITTGGERPPVDAPDTIEGLDRERLGALGRAAQDLLLRLDDAAELGRSTQSYLYLGTRVLRGWTVQFLLLAALLPFLVATVDLFARCRRRHVPLRPALRSFASRLGVWLWAGLLFAAFAAAGLLVTGEPIPINPDSTAVQDPPLAALAALAVLAGLGWVLARPRLAPHRPVTRVEDLGGHLAAMLVLALVALVVAATNPYALLFVLPSLHAWLWLPHVSRRNVPLRLAVYAAGFAGPLLLVGSFAWRYGLGLDAPWYLLALASVGYVTPPLLVAGLVWAAAAAQVGAVVLGRYAPYPARAERPGRGPVREGIRRAVLASRSRRERVEPERESGEA